MSNIIKIYNFNYSGLILFYYFINNFLKYYYKLTFLYDNQYESPLLEGAPILYTLTAASSSSGGTWDNIILEHKERNEKHKKSLELKQLRKDIAKKNFIKFLRYMGNFIFIGITAVGTFYLIISNMKK